MPVRVTSDKTYWPDGNGRQPLAGVNAFGLSGANAHVLVEGHGTPAGADEAGNGTLPPAGVPKPVPVSLPEPDCDVSMSEEGLAERTTRLLPLSGKSADALRDLAERYLSWLSNQEDSASHKALSDMAWTAAVGRSHFPHRAGLVFSDASQLQKGLRAVAAGEGVANLHLPDGTIAVREANALEWLDEKELSRWREFRYPGPRRRFALCREALRALLCERLGCENDRLEFGAAEYEKPFAILNGSPAPVTFNVSHSGKHGLIAIADRGRVGIDVEEFSTRPKLDLIVETVFGPEEQKVLASLRGRQKTRLFFRLWTIKESLIKAIGMGLSMDMSQFEVPPAMRHGSLVSVFQFPHLPTVRWRLEYIGNDDFAAAVAHDLDSAPSARPTS